jgi:hypothetical protein
MRPDAANAKSPYSTGDKVSVRFNSSGSNSAGANVVSYGGINVQVIYSGKSTFVQNGKGVPLVLRARMFKLDNNSGHLQFPPVTGPEAKRFNFQHAIKQSQ